MPSKEAALKAKELRWFSAAQVLCADLPSGEPLQPSPPSPDIVFVEPDVGIEITEFLGKEAGGSKPRQLEAFRKEVVAEAKRAFNAVCTQRLFVSVYWTRDKIPPSSVRDCLVRGITDTVRDLLAADRASWKTPWRPDWSRPGDRLLGEYVGEIWASGDSASDAWTCANGIPVPGAVEKVQSVIDGKNPLVGKYRDACSAVWLLIVAEMELSSCFSPDEDFETAIFRTDFDRVFVYDVFRKHVRELPLCSEKP